MSADPGAESLDGIVNEQLNYYEARAPEYDHWFFRRGRYDRGARANSHWFNEIDEVRFELARGSWNGRHVLELAPGTGLWSEWLLNQGATLSVVDGSPAMLSELRIRLAERSTNVNYEIANLFEWQPTETYDGCFFGFFLSHVPRSELSRFFGTVARTLMSGGLVGFVDSLREPTSTAADHSLPAENNEVMVRRLDDGREFRIVKNFFDAHEISAAALDAGIELRPRVTANYFNYAVGTRI